MRQIIMLLRTWREREREKKNCGMYHKKTENDFAVGVLN